MNQTFSHKTRGFTLLELLIVVGILAALVAISLPYYKDYVSQANLTKARGDHRTFANALSQFDQLEITMFNKNNDLTPLIGKYLNDFRKQNNQVVPTDPWGNNYVISAPRGYLLSLGPDGLDQTTGGLSATGILVAGGDDLLTRWKGPLFVAGARYGGPTTFYVDVSRKLSKSTAANTLNTNYTLTLANTNLNTNFAVALQDDPAIVRVSLNTGTLANSGLTRITLSAGITSQDGQATWENNPATNTNGASGTFTVP